MYSINQEAKWNAAKTKSWQSSSTQPLQWLLEEPQQSNQWSFSGDWKLQLLYGQELASFIDFEILGQIM